MAEGARDELRARQPTTHNSRVEAVEADIVRTRERLSLALTALNGEVRALLDPNTSVTLASADTRDVADKIAAGLRATGQMSALARARKSGPFGILTAATGLGVFLFRVGPARLIWNRKKRGHQARHAPTSVEPGAHPCFPQRDER
jgi:hypothetical protein